MPSTPTPERWREIQRVFHGALDLPAEQRAAYLSVACADDAALRHEVELLISLDGDDGDLLGTGRGEALGTLARDALGEAPPASWAGRRIGPYVIVDEIGRGGMGTVYRAERADVGLTVALKVVAGGLAAPERIDRFLVERRVLARLDHPNIARLLDAGVLDDGTPWLAMEHVRGEPIASYCDARRLTVGERLALVERVCDAVAYAHRTLVVHRDIKPANILVGEDGVPKLLDFGIAKLLDEHDENGGLTGTGVRLLTPGYAAPEQLTGDGVTVASDVYALGVVLYELLCGRRPYRAENRTPMELGRFLREHPLPPPSAALTRIDEAKPGADEAASRTTTLDQLRRMLAGDLDAIVMRAIAIEPERRYRSVESLLDDLRRYREGLPVDARPDSRGYRVRKFVARHRVAVGATASLAIVLVGVATAMTVLQTRTARALTRARIEQARAEEVTRFVSGLFAASNPYEIGSDTISVRGMLERGVARVDQLRAQPEVQARLLGVIGRAYLQLGQPGAALPLHRRELATFRRIEPQGGRELASAMFDVAYDLSESRQYDSALVLHRAALAMQRRLFGERDLDVAQSLSRIGATEISRSDFAAAEQHLREALAIHRSLAKPDTGALESTINNLAVSLYVLGRYAGGDSLFRDLIAIRRVRFGPHHPVTGWAIGNLGLGLAEQGRGREAEPLLREALSIARASLPPSHQGVISPLTGLARAVAEQDRYAEAESLYREVITLRRVRGGDMWGAVGPTLVQYADLERRRGEFRAADSLYREADAALRASVPPTHASVADLLVGRASLLMAEHRPGEAEPLVRRALDILRRTRGEAHPRTHAAERLLAEARSAERKPPSPSSSSASSGSR